MVETIEKINIETGLHAKPANVLMETAEAFKSKITIYKGDKEVDGKRLLAILTLAAKKGDEIRIVAEGEDEKEAIEAISKVIRNNFKED